MGTTRNLTLFTRITERSLNSWQRKLQNVDESHLRTLLPQQELLYQAVYKGFSLESLWEKSADVALAAVFLIDRFNLSRQWLPLLERILESCPNANPYRRCHLLNIIGQSYRELQTSKSHDKALELHKESFRLATQLKDRFLQAQAHCQLAADYFWINQFGKSEEHSQKALQLFKSANPKTQDLAFAHNILGQSLLYSGNFDSADKHLLAALSLFQQVDAPIRTARVNNGLGLRHHYAQEYDKAIEYFEQAIQLSTSALDQSRYQMNLGASYFKIGEFGIAKDIFFAIDVAFLREIGQTNLLAIVMQSTGNVLMSNGEVQEAIPFLHEAIILWESRGDNLQLANSLGTLGQCYLKLELRSDGLFLLQRAVTLLDDFRQDLQGSSLLREFTLEIKNESG